MTRPLVAAKPVLKAAPRPRFHSWKTKRQRGSPTQIASITDRVSSWLQSSTKTISHVQRVASRTSITLRDAEFAQVRRLVVAGNDQGQIGRTPGTRARLRRHASARRKARTTSAASSSVTARERGMREGPRPTDSAFGSEPVRSPKVFR